MHAYILFKQQSESDTVCKSIDDGCISGERAGTD